MIKAIKLKKIIIAIIIIFFVIFLIFNYKKIFCGNNISKNRIDKKVEKVIQNIQNYSADIEVEIKSNKTKNKYIIHQEVNDNYSMQEVLDGEFIKGLKLEYDGENLKISNVSLKLEKSYQNHIKVLNNSLFLNTFFAELDNEENEKNIYEENEEIILDVKLNNSMNTYIKNKTLYVNKESLLPTRLIVKDDVQNEIISIKYNNIEIK